MATYIIFVLVIIFLMAGSFFWMWKLSKYLVIPIQIALFILLIIVVVKVFATRENADKLKGEIEQSGIAKLESSMVSASSNAVRSSVKSNDVARPTASDSVGKTAPATDAKPAGGNGNFVDML